MSSRRRMLAAIDRAPVDYVPCSCMMYKALQLKSDSYLDFIERQLDLGLDAFVQIPPRDPHAASDTYNLHGLPVSFDPRVEIKEWVDQLGRNPLLIKEYRTPEGTLRAEVEKTADWPWGDHIPFFDDHIIPRSKKFLVEGPDDLPALDYLLQPPTERDIGEFNHLSQPLLEYAQQKQLIVAGGWGVGADVIGWLHGLVNLVFTSFDRADFLHDLINLIGKWNQSRMRAVLGAGIDLYVKRAWYENLDFWTPSTYRQFIRPVLVSDVELAHSFGAKFAYVITSNCMELLEIIAESGVDVIIGVDPLEWDLERAKRIVGERICLWGGINGHLTIEQGSPADVRSEVRRAFEVLSPGGGFVLSPVDNVRQDTTLSRRNMEVMLEEWRAIR